jgi:hypothetical protein
MNMFHAPEWRAIRERQTFASGAGGIPCNLPSFAAVVVAAVVAASADPAASGQPSCSVAPLLLPLL